MDGIEQLRGWMKRKKLNMTETAEYLGWHLSLMSLILAGKRRPTLDQAAQLDDEAGIPPKAWVSSSRSTLRKKAMNAGKKGQSLQGANSDAR